MRIAQIFEAISLQRREIISIAQFAPQSLEIHPIALLAFIAYLAFQITHQIRDDVVIAEQRVIDIKEENDFLR
jgi:hypothetical protein